MNEYLEQYLNIMQGKDRFSFLSEERYGIVRKYSFAIPDDTALEIIASHAPIVEIGAGSGYWAHLLRERGVDIIAYDKVLKNNPYGFNMTWTEIKYGTPGHLILHPDRSLLLCWPDYNDSFALRAIRKYPGDTIVYIGENYGGCNGNDKFFDELEINWELIQEHLVNQWPGIHDSMKIFTRVKNNDKEATTRNRTRHRKRN